jgi:putative two-component system response regulator
MRVGFDDCNDTSLAREQVITKRILIVDDDPANVLLLESFLKADDRTIRSVADARTAEEAIGAFDPDIVLLDLHMPGLDGFEILRRLRGAHAEFLPVVILTADADPSTRHRALILGADDFLTKPLDRHDVVLRVRNLLRTRQLHRELAQANDALERQLKKRESDTSG